jgi:hypothetical protein
MPYWNRPREWAQSKAAYLKQYPDLDLEFSICDDGSITPLEDSRARIWRLPVKGQALNPCVPMNFAVLNSSHDVIVLTNPEIEHREPVLKQMLENLNNVYDVVMTGCNDEKRGWIAGPLAPRAPVGGRQPMPPDTWPHFCTMMHRSLFECVGGFDEDFRHVPGCDDNEFMWRLHALGANFKYVEGTVWHNNYNGRVRWKGTLEEAAALLRKKCAHIEGFPA